MAKPLIVRSFAKINLFLDIICKREDGYHNIETVFQSIDMHDHVSLELLPSGLDIHCDDAEVPSDLRNLAVKAFLAIQQALDYRGGVRILITKRIPPGSGLGGGSSNAAAVLRAVNHLLNGGIPNEELHQMAQALGADVPFFLTGGLAAAWGIGERLEVLPPFPESSLVIAVPAEVTVSTALAYSKVDVPRCSGAPPKNLRECTESMQSFVDSLSGSLPLHANAPLMRAMFNELEGPVFALFPQVARLKQCMLECGVKAALMSGSGSAVFGLAETPDDAHLIRRKIAASFPCKAFVAATGGSGADWL